MRIPGGLESPSPDHRSRAARRRPRRLRRAPVAGRARRPGDGPGAGPAHAPRTRGSRRARDGGPQSRRRTSRGADRRELPAADGRAQLGLAPGSWYLSASAEEPAIFGWYGSNPVQIRAGETIEVTIPAVPAAAAGPAAPRRTPLSP